MKIVFYGDSITDAGRSRETDFLNESYGRAYVFDVASELMTKEPNKYEIYNRGVGGNRVVDLYARIKKDLWNLEPDLISIFIGVNDVWHEIGEHNGVELDRFENVYKMMLEDTIKRLPNSKIMLVEPYVMHGDRTDKDDDYSKFVEVFDYAKVVEKLAKEYGLYFVPLQKTLDEKAEKYGSKFITFDGVHPNITGSKVIADEWLKVFKTIK
jgi:lysophospholipase L1-like esterase